MRYHLSLFLTAGLTLALAMPLLAGQPAPRLEQNRSQSQVDQLRADYAKLKIEMNQTLVQLRQFKQQLAASKQSPPVPDATALDRKINQLIAAQSKLEKKVDDLAPAPQTSTPRARPTATATTDLNSPYAYRYNAPDRTPGSPGSPGTSNTSAPSPDANAPQPTAATYTTYANGYTSGYYVPPVKPLRTTGPAVYVTPQPYALSYRPTYTISPRTYGFPFYRSSYFYRSNYNYPNYFYRSRYGYHRGLSIGIGFGFRNDHRYFGRRASHYFGRHHDRDDHHARRHRRH